MAWIGIRRRVASLITFSTSVALPLSRPSETTMIALGAGRGAEAALVPAGAAYIEIACERPWMDDPEEPTTLTYARAWGQRFCVASTCWTVSCAPAANAATGAQSAARPVHSCFFTGAVTRASRAWRAP